MIKVQVMGPFNSGTNLLIDILTDNTLFTDDPEERVEVSENMLLWKHTLRTDFIANRIKEKKHMFVIMYKNVYNWVFSIQKNPYDITLEKGIGGAVSMQGFHYDNLIQLYNRYYNMYRDMLEKYPDQVIFMDYHRIIQEDAKDYISSKLSALRLKLKEVSAVDRVLSKPSKTHGKECAHDAKEARERYQKIQDAMSAYVASHSGMAPTVRPEIFSWFGEEGEK